MVEGDPKLSWPVRDSVAPESALTRRDSHHRAIAGAESGPLRLPSRFQLKQALGRGGMSVVYRVYDRVAGHDVALKHLRGVSAEDRLRLKSEFRALSHIVHPNLVDLYELVMEEHASFYTMELVNGVDFCKYTASLRETCSDSDERSARFRDVARQLALALNALHEGEKLHRDVKPSNVLVTEAGRVVLLDFGLTISTRESQVEDELAGTFVYMSPEQRWGRSVTPASDWYCFAMTLYEAVSGKVTSNVDLLTVGASARSLRERGYDVPEDMDQLIGRLLSVDPEARPAAPEILRCLGGSRREEERISLVPQSIRPNLVGRGDVLSELQRHYELAAGGPRLLRVSGPSGIGKSSLIRAFLEDIAGESRTLALRSRCHPQEEVVFNAVDGFIDDLSNQVRERLTPEERRLPALQHDALMQVFPVLAKALFGSGAAPIATASDHDRRLLAFEALRETLERISRHARIVAWLDDAQWADQDSGILLRHLLRGPDSPALTLIISYRSEDEADSPCLRILRDDAEFWNKTQAIHIAALDAGQSEELMDGLLGVAWRGNESARSELLRASAGSPFLLQESARYLSQRPAETTDGATLQIGLDDILRVRTNNLPADCRTVLEVLAVAGAPTEQWITLAAADLDSARRGLLTDLERLSIIRTTDAKSHRIEFYHDKLREEVLRQLSQETLSRHHQALGRALLASGTPNPLAALDHFDAAGDVEAVRRYVVTAANHAFKLLAFERAARLYQRAIELVPGEIDLHELYRRLGSSLGSAGRGNGAAAAFSTAAALLKQSPGASAEEVMQLRQKAAEQFIQTGHFQQGLEVLRHVLGEYGIVLPKSREEALRKATGLRLFSLLSGFRPRRGQAAPDEFQLSRFDALWSATTRLAMVDYALCNYAAARCARDAMQLNEPSRMSRALAMEASFSSMLPQPLFQRRARTLLTMAETFARSDSATPYDSTFALGARAIIDFYAGRYRQTWQQIDVAIARLRAHSTGRQWEEGPWQMWSLLGLALCGELAELIRRVREARDDAVGRDDRQIQQNISLGAPTLAWLALDEVDEAQQRADLALSWAPAGYTAQHYHHYVTSVDYALYRGDAFGAWQRTLDTWQTHERENFLMLAYIRDDLLRTRGRAALASALELRRLGRARTASGYDAAQLLSVAKRALKTMARHDLPPAGGFSLLLEAGISNFERDRARASNCLERAMHSFEHGDMQLFREVARFCLGRLRADATGDQQVSTAERWLRAQGVVKPEKLVNALAPGLLAGTESA